MNVERRKSFRVTVTLDAVVNHRAQSVICTMRDISFSGAFIDAEPELLPFAGAVELGFSLPDGGGHGYVKLPATIQRVTEDGAAVMFGDIGGDAYFRLVDMVTASASSIPTHVIR